MGPKEWNCPTSVIWKIERAQLKLRVVPVSLTQDVRNQGLLSNGGPGNGLLP